MYETDFVYPLFYDGYYGCFHPFTIVKNAAINMSVKIFVWVSAWLFGRYISRCGTAGSYGKFSV